VCGCVCVCVCVRACVCVCARVYLLQGVGGVEDGRAGAAGGGGGRLGAARGRAGAGALHRQALLVAEAQLGEQLLVPVHRQLDAGGKEKGRGRQSFRLHLWVLLGTSVIRLYAPFQNCHRDEVTSQVGRVH